MANVRHSADDYVLAALAINDEQGMDALTMRSLGEAMHIHGTAVYRHFPRRDDLLSAVMDHVVSGMAARVLWDDPDPRIRLLSMMRALRDSLAEHPNLVSAFIQSSGTWESGFEATRASVAALEELGLKGRNLVVAAQMIESYIVGATAFDYAGAPEHLEMRRVRRRSLAHPAFDPLTRDTEQIHDVNEEAFVAGCNALLDACARMAQP